MITTIQQGDSTTIQDRGRFGYQAYGMPVAGAMDQYAYAVANLLVGNRDDAAMFEMTGFGGAFKFDEKQFVAVCGADMQGELNGVSIKNWSSFIIPKGGEIRFNRTIIGYRTYLAVGGGLEIPMILGSRSTYARAKVGGYEGRTLRQGDVFYVGNDQAGQVQPRNLEVEFIPQYTEEIRLRVLLGPQDDLFTESMIQTFLQSVYVVSEQAGRTGYRLKGPMIKPKGKADIVSDAIWQGAIQISDNGMPFIMTADHQTTGGFAKIGSVIRVDLSKLAQARPGDRISFMLVTEEEAIHALRYEKQSYLRIAASMNYLS
ncbi:biotin-dependent carboxyltransferase family protein [Pelosinus sp. sgz500959]|uniref:5-oxoprolinase subunit C family protein n=1 Tax=Pelosinus sp. sgz500959 TaxID=3242472 RepID=UPI00366D5026